MFRGIMGMLILVFIGATLLIGGTLHKLDLEQGEIRDIYNYTEQIDINYSCSSKYNNEYGLNGAKIHVGRITKISCLLADFTINTFMEVTKWGIEFGYENPQYDYDFYFKIVKIWAYAIILSVVLPLIIPLMALIYLLGIGIQKGMLKLKNRKKRRIKNNGRKIS